MSLGFIDMTHPRVAITISPSIVNCWVARCHRLEFPVYGIPAGLGLIFGGRDS